MNDQTAMNRRSPAAGYSVGPWEPDGTATLEAWGDNARTAFEAGLGALLQLVPEPPIEVDPAHAAPIRGEGSELGTLFADLVEDLLEQAGFFGEGVRDVGIDGVLRRDGGGFVAWGYATGTLGSGGAVDMPRLENITAKVDDSGGVTLRATLRRP